MGAADRIYEEIRQRIIRGQWAPGQPLAEVALAEEMGASRTPVREALLRLRAEGLAVRGEAGTLVVVQPTAQDVLDLADLRAVIERYVAGRAAERASAAEAQALVELGEAADEGQAEEVEWPFHEAMIAMARLSPLAGALQASSVIHYSRTLVSIFMGPQPAAARPPTSADSPGSTHRAIAEAIAARDSAAAEEAAYHHALVSRDGLARALMGLAETVV